LKLQLLTSIDALIRMYVDSTPRCAISIQVSWIMIHDRLEGVKVVTTGRGESRS